MDKRFSQLLETLHPSFERLISMQALVHGRLPQKMPKQGVYLFSERDQHLYVGRSNTLKRRFGQHCNSGSQDNQAVFAFKLAREATGNIMPGYAPGKRTKKELMKIPEFRVAFGKEKARIRNMDYRFVEETDQTRQVLLEIYCAIVLRCRYNDFDTH